MQSCPPLSEPRFSDMLQAFTVHQVRQAAARRLHVLERVRTADAARRYRDRVLQRWRRCFGRFPARTPLNPVYTGQIRDTFGTIEKLHFQSRPNHTVTAVLYRPKGRGPFPAVLFPCGHSTAGKAHPLYQQCPQRLVSQGMIVLVYDPISQGERGQYPDVHLPHQPHGSVEEHNMAGKQMGLLGQFFGQWRAWDGLRALDLLYQRDDVDREHVGVTGCSGGGTLSSYLNLLDDRLTMAAPVCYITSFLHNCKNELPCDSEQIPPGALAMDLDMADLLIARAPRPLLIAGEERDFFDHRGTQLAFEQTQRIYDLLGARDNVRLFIGKNAHDYSPQAGEAIAHFFADLCKLKHRPMPRHFTIRSPQTLAATPTGQVLDLPGEQAIHDLVRESANAVAKTRPHLTHEALRRTIAEILQLPPRPQPPALRVLRSYRVDFGPSRPSQQVWAWAVETEPEMLALLELWENPPLQNRPYLTLQPAQQRAVLYLPHQDSQADRHAGLMPKGDHVYSLDVRGMGACRPLTCDHHNRDLLASYGCEYFYVSHGLMLGQSLVGRRVHDVLVTLDVLESHGFKHLTLHARGYGALLATFAACLHPLVDRVYLRDAPHSFHQWSQTPHIAWPQSAMPWGALQRFDLPDCYRLLRQEKRLTIFNRIDAQMRTICPGPLHKGFPHVAKHF